MSKLLLLLTFFGLLLMAVGTQFSPQSPAFWLADNTLLYQAVRLGLAAILFTQLVTRPPRGLWFRCLAISLGFMTGAFVVQETYNYQMQLFDSWAFLSAALAIGITGLEPKTRPTPTSVSRQPAY